MSVLMRSVTDASSAMRTGSCKGATTAETRKRIRSVRAAIAAHDIVVVGMRQNPFPKSARKALDAAGLKYHYLEYGSYLADWRRRLALKMWTGWPTIPMVFVKGVLVGGAEDLERLIASGGLK